MDNTTTTLESRIGSLLAQETSGSRNRWRTIKDRIAKHGVAVGGIAVILSVVLIFFYLLYVVFPVFRGAEMTPLAHYSLPAREGAPVYLALDEYGEVGFRVDARGHTYFFKADDGKLIREHTLPLPAGASVVSFGKSQSKSGEFVLGLSNGQVIIGEQTFKISYPQGTRITTPALAFPYGEAPITLDEAGRALTRVAMQGDDSGLVLVGTVAEGKALIAKYSLEENMMTETTELNREEASEIVLNGSADYLLLDGNARRLYVADRKGVLDFYQLNGAEAKLAQRLEIGPKSQEITDIQFLLGSYSLLVGDSTGTITQWFPVRGDKGRQHMAQVRSFQLGDKPVTGIITEARRKGFLAVDAGGQLGIFHSTAERTLLKHEIDEKGVRAFAISDRSHRLIAEHNSGELEFFSVENEHPELSWSSLWGKVWYEGYDKPDYVYQSSASNNDFEPKFSLTPLAFGTLKAALYAMLFAIPLAIGAAMYTAFFMAPGMRVAVKPTIEIMGALPSVILGFLAGLWLAPFLEHRMPGVFLFLIMTPVALVLFGLVWKRMPLALQSRFGNGWQGALAIPVIIATAALSMLLDQPVEDLLFGGNMPAWLSNVAGIGYDQRNSLVVGIAMGFAVIPSIYSIAEDAVFSVPKSLVNGSLALGASPWQTMVRVILPTASPGIFSALMIGMGRAVGETMIVLMATGNTPIMEANIFEGLRTLSANIAVEMPESEVGSSHYRVLFLAALVLFLFTFVVNTAAELIRNRLRKKYGSL